LAFAYFPAFNGGKRIAVYIDGGIVQERANQPPPKSVFPAVW
jgi:hypothetical protein